MWIFYDAPAPRYIAKHYEVLTSVSMPLELTLAALRRSDEVLDHFGAVRGLRFPYLSRLTRGRHFRKSQSGSTFRVEFDAMPRDVILATLTGFASLGRDDRLTHSRHVFAYYQEIMEGISPAEEAEVTARFVAPIKAPRDVWRNVWIHRVGVCESRGSAWLQVFFGCAWEEEHGLSMSFERGRVLTRVGGIDGHPYNVARSGRDKRGPYERCPEIHAGRRYPTYADEGESRS